MTGMMNMSRCMEANIEQFGQFTDSFSRHVWLYRVSRQLHRDSDTYDAACAGRATSEKIPFRNWSNQSSDPFHKARRLKLVSVLAARILLSGLQMNNVVETKSVSMLILPVHQPLARREVISSLEQPANSPPSRRLSLVSAQAPQWLYKVVAPPISCH